VGNCCPNSDFWLKLKIWIKIEILVGWKILIFVKHQNFEQKIKIQNFQLDVQFCQRLLTALAMNSYDFYLQSQNFRNMAVYKRGLKLRRLESVPLYTIRLDQNSYLKESCKMASLENFENKKIQILKIQKNDKKNQNFEH